MTDEPNSNRQNQAKWEKITGFANWPVWLGNTKFMLIEKDVFIQNSPRV